MKMETCYELPKEKISYKNLIVKEDLDPKKNYHLIFPNITRKSASLKLDSPIEIAQGTLEGLVDPRTGNPMRVGMIKMRTSLNYHCQEQVCNFIEEVSSLREYDLIVGPEYTFAGPLSSQESLGYRRRLRTASKKRTAIIPGTFVTAKEPYLSNETFVYDNGEEIFSYTKMIDGGEKDFANENGLIAEFGESPGVFNLWNYRCGIEICTDRWNEATLGRGVLYVNGVSNLDIYFLISCGVSFPSLECIRKGGYSLVVDGSLEKCEVKRKLKD